MGQIRFCEDEIERMRLKTAYFVANSSHYLPTVFPLIQETGGVVLTLRQRVKKHIQKTNQYSRIEPVCFRDTRRLLRYVQDREIAVVVHPSFSIHRFKGVQNAKHVQVFHGTSDKPFNFHKSLHKYDLIVVPGPRMKEEILKRGLASAEKIAVIGYPKIDMFLHSDFNTEDFKKRVGIEGSKKTILYSPTWDDPDHYSSFSKYMLVILRDLGEYNVIVKPHPNIMKYRPWQILRAYLMKKKNSFLYARSSDILPFMAVSDLLITDISSVSHEYLPFRKPMVFLNPRPKGQIPQAHAWIWHCGDVAEDMKSVKDLVKENLENPLKYRAEREDALRQIFVDFDGRSCLRFKKALKKLTATE